MKKPVIYDINDDGDCKSCSLLFRVGNINGVCLAYSVLICDYTQCQACEEFLAKEKAKIYCSDCIHNGDYPDWSCDMGKPMRENCKFKVKE
jgi:hypothetical protein